MLAEDELPSRCRHGWAHIPTDDDDADDLDAKNAEAVIQFMYLETCGWLSYPFLSVSQPVIANNKFLPNLAAHSLLSRSDMFGVKWSRRDDTTRVA